MQKYISKTTALALVILCFPAFTSPVLSPDQTQGEGPFDRLILRGVKVINGEGVASPVIIGPLAMLGFLDQGETHERQEI